MHPVSGDAEAIARAHGLDAETAAAVVALRTRGLEVSLGVADAAGRDPAVAALLADRGLHRAGDACTPHDLRAIARRCDVAGDAGLTIQRVAGQACLALADELAGTALDLPTRPEAAPFVSVAGGGTVAALESWRRDALQLATGLDPDERLRALAALMRAELPADARRGCALFALRDESARVRRAACTALRHAGLETAVADACQALLAESRAERRRGLAALDTAARPESDRLALAAVLVAAGACLHDPDYAGEHAALLRLCGRLGRAAAAEPAMLADLLALLLREAAAGPTEAGAALREALRGLALARPPGLAPRLLAEAARLDPSPGRTAVLLTVSELPLSGPDRARFEALLLGAELDRFIAVGEGGVPFRAFVARHGARLLAGLGARAERERGERRAAVLALVAVALRDAEPAPSRTARRAVARTLARLVADRDPATTVAVLRTGIAADAGVAATHRRPVVAAGLELVAAGTSAEFAEEVLGAAAGLDGDSLPLLLAFAGDDLVSRPLRRAALDHAAAVAAAAPPDGPGGRRVVQALRAARRLARRRGFALADAVTALCGELATHPAVPATLRDAVRDDLLRRLGAAPDPVAAGAAEGLRAWCAAHADTLDEAARAALAHALLRLVTTAQSAAVVAGGDTRAEGTGAAMQARAIPAAMATLTTVAGGPAVIPIAHAVLNWWGRVTRGELVLGPAARRHVAATLADLALSAAERSPAIRARAATALMAEYRRTGEVPLVPVLARVLAAPPPMPAAENSTAALCRELLALADARETSDEERAIALAGAGTLVAAGAVPRDRAEPLMPGLIRVVRRVRAGDPAVARALRGLVALPWVTREDRQALEALLAAAAALVQR